MGGGPFPHSLPSADNEPLKRIDWQECCDGEVLNRTHAAMLEPSRHIYMYAYPQVVMQKTSDSHLAKPEERGIRWQGKIQDKDDSRQGKLEQGVVQLLENPIYGKEVVYHKIEACSCF